MSLSQGFQRVPCCLEVFEVLKGFQKAWHLCNPWRCFFSFHFAPGIVTPPKRIASSRTSQLKLLKRLLFHELSPKSCPKRSKKKHQKKHSIHQKYTRKTSNFQKKKTYTYVRFHPKISPKLKENHPPLTSHLPPPSKSPFQLLKAQGLRRLRLRPAAGHDPQGPAWGDEAQKWVAFFFSLKKKKKTCFFPQKKRFNGLVKKKHRPSY